MVIICALAPSLSHGSLLSETVWVGGFFASSLVGIKSTKNYYSWSSGMTPSTWAKMTTLVHNPKTSF